MLLTVVVTHDTVLFYKNLEELGAVAISRPVVECTSSRGLLIGDGGLTLGQLRFYPTNLSMTDIEEIYTSGALLRDIARGAAMPSLGVSKVGTVCSSPELSVQQEEDDEDQIQESAARHILMAARVEAMKAGADEDAAQSALEVSPPLPFGSIAVNSTPVYDGVTGREYVALLPDAWRLAEPEGDLRERFFDPATMPGFNGTGVTFSFWYRSMEHPATGEGAGVKGGYLLVAQWRPERSRARETRSNWAIWVEQDRMWLQFITGRGDFEDQAQYYPFLDIPDDQKVDHRAWRHLAWQYDVFEDRFRFFLDGVPAYDMATPIPVSEIWASNHNLNYTLAVTVGHSQNSWNFPSTAEVADLRMYIGAPLSSEEVLALAQEPVPWRQCLSQEILDVGGWVDELDHSCAWYHGAKVRYPGVCSFSEAITNCPVTCSRVPRCFAPRHKDLPVYHIWNRIRRVEPSSSNGTLCLSDRLHRDQVLAECRSPNNVYAGYNTWDWTVRNDGDAPRVNLMDCEELALAIDSGCTFRAEEVDHFTRDIAAGQYDTPGSFTLHFWVKPLNEDSLSADGRFEPSIAFFSQLAPPLSPLSRVPLEALTYMHLYYCDTEQPDLGCGHSSGISDLALGKWTFLAYSFKNTSKAIMILEQQNLIFGTTQLSAGYHLSIYPDVPLFNSIELGPSMLMSPIALIPRALKAVELQELYYQNYAGMAARTGPRSTDQARLTSRIHVSKENYLPTTALVAPPIVLQKRAQAAEECPYDFSNRWLRRQHDRTRAVLCSYPNQCSEEVLTQPNALISCPGAQNVDTYFGLNATSFRFPYRALKASSEETAKGSQLFAITIQFDSVRLIRFALFTTILFDLSYRSGISPV
eukprot:gene4401-5408_t